MKRMIPRICAVAILGLCGCSKVVSTVRAYTTNGKNEIATAFQMKAAAKSFRMTTKIAAHEDNVMETQFEVSCPDRERITLKMGPATRQMIRVGQRFYLNEDGNWYYKDVEVKNWSPCGRNPGLPSPWALLTEGRDLLTVFAIASDKFEVKAASPLEYNGKKYETFTVAMNHNGGSSPFSYTVLLDQNHRPAVIVLGRSSMTEYSDWDLPLNIAPPANALPYPENAPVPAAHPGTMHGHGM